MTQVRPGAGLHARLCCYRACCHRSPTNARQILSCHVRIVVSGQGRRSAKKRAGQIDFELRARVVIWPPLRLSRLRCECVSVDVAQAKPLRGLGGRFSVWAAPLFTLARIAAMPVSISSKTKACCSSSMPAEPSFSDRRPKRARSKAFRIWVSRSMRSSASAFLAFRVSISSGSCRSGGVMTSTRAYFAPVFLPFQAVDSLCRRHLPNNLRRLHRHRAHPFPVHAVNQRHELGMVELDSVVAYPRPAKLRFLQPLGVKADPGSIPPDDLDPVSPTTDILHTVLVSRRSPIRGIRCLGARCGFRRIGAARA